MAEGESSLVFISGHSGIGKTALIHTAQLGLPAPRFFYISGKFDQVNKFIPYSAFLQAATDLLRQLLAMSEDMVEMYKHKIIEALGANAQVLFIYCYFILFVLFYILLSNMVWIYINKYTRLLLR